VSFSVSIPADKPTTRLRETLQILRLCLSGDKVDFTGELFKVRGFQLELPPKGRFPIFGAAMGLKIVESIVDVVEGVLTMIPTLEHVGEIKKTIEAATTRLSLDKEPAIACHHVTAVSEDRDRAEEIAKKSLLDYVGISVYRNNFVRMGFANEVRDLERMKSDGGTWKGVPTDMTERLIIYGTPEECITKIKRFVEAGVTHPIIYPSMTPEGFPDNVNETIRLFAPYL
jgi:5,10-methylenetetrahydromethanopterin reductase